MLRKLIVGLAVACLISGVVYAGGFSMIPLGGAPPAATIPSNGPGVNTWNVYPLGAGGFETGYSVAADGTMLVRTDTGGYYQWNASAPAPNGTTGVWQQGVTTTAMPAIFGANGQGYYQGVAEVQVCGSNSNYQYLAYPVALTGNATIYISSTKGATWTASNYTPNTNGDNWQQNGSTSKNNQNHIATDPNSTNCAKTFVGASHGSLEYTTDGGSTWTTVSTGQVPTPLAGPAGSGCGPCYPGYTIAIDPNSASGGVSQTIIVFSYGNGIYQNTTAGTGTWTKINSSSGPAEITQGYFDATNHTFYCVEYSVGNGGTGINFWTYASGTWTERLTGSVQAVAVDPQTSGHIVVLDQSGTINESFNSGATFTGVGSQTKTFSSTGDVTWIADSQNTQFGAGINTAFFSPSNTKQIFATGGQNFWTTTWTGNLASNSVIAWQTQSRGIEDLVGIRITIPPGAPQATYNGSSINADVSFASAWDFGGFYKPCLTCYATTNVISTSLAALWSVDYCSSNPANMTAYADGSYAGGPTFTAYSTNYGSSWTDVTLPTNGATGFTACSTPSNYIEAYKNQPYYTTNGQAGSPTFTALSSSQIPGQTSWSGWADSGVGDNSGAVWVTADRVNANQFTILMQNISDTTATTTNSGASWTVSSVSIGIGAGKQIKAVPNNANHIFYADGIPNVALPSNQPAGSTLQYTTNASCATTNCVSWTTVTTVYQAERIGYGKSSSTACSGACSYPAVYLTGWIKGTTSTTVTGAGSFNLTVTGATGDSFNNGASVVVSNGSTILYGNITANTGTCASSCTVSVTMLGYQSGSGSCSSCSVYVYGVFRSDVNSPSATMPWAQLGTWPINQFDYALDINGDMDNRGYVYLAYGAYSFVYGYFP